MWEGPGRVFRVTVHAQSPLTVEGLVDSEPVVMDDPRVPLEFLGPG